MNNVLFNPLIIALGVIAFFNLLLLILCLFLFWRSKKALEYTRRVLVVEDHSRHNIEAHAEVLMDRLVSELVTGFKTTFADMSSAYAKSLAEAAGDQIVQMGQYTAGVQKQIGEEAQLVSARLVDGASAEIEQYKNLQMMRVDEEVPKIIEAVSKEVFGKAISLEAHQDLVLEALKRAKMDGIFSQRVSDKSKLQISAGAKKTVVAKMPMVAKVLKTKTTKK